MLLNRRPYEEELPYMSGRKKQRNSNPMFSFLFPLKGFIPNPHNLHKIIFLCIIDGWVVGGGAN
jgi:hypothetical protein